MNHYVYFITNEDKMKYIGVRSSKCNPEEDTKYWGSSKYLPKDISETGVKEIVETLDTREEAVALEVELHNKWNVAVNPWFYNQAKQTSTGFDTQGMPRSAAASEMAASKLRGRTKETHLHIAKAAAKMTGRTKATCPGRAAQAEKLTGMLPTQAMLDGKLSMSKKMLGVNNPMHSNNSKWQITCQHCERTMDKGNHTRHHGDNCKYKGGS